MNSLIQPLFNGPIDIVGDIHGEIQALQNLLSRMGYDAEGKHTEGRRLVFVGDLTDRGPDSPAVVRLVRRFVESGRAQCVLGNHDLNLLLGLKKHDNYWFYGEEHDLDGGDDPTPAVLADDAIRSELLDFLQTLPLALERADLRVVHACWNSQMIEVARSASAVVPLFQQHEKLIDELAKVHSEWDEIDQGLKHQNENPVKVLTSGHERRVAVPFEASGKVRYEERVSWWEDYQDEPFCVFGHYARTDISTPSACCIDYGVAKRWQERKQPEFTGQHKLRLAALRFPERATITDNGTMSNLETI